MKAAVCRKPGKFEVIEVPDPQVSKGEVLIQVKACGICGSDKMITNFLQNGMIEGHEGAGVVVEGKGINLLGKEIKRGDRVYIFPCVPCGKCYFCKENKPVLCENARVIGHGNFFEDAEPLPGTWAEYIKVPAACAIELPPKVEFEESVFDTITALAGVNRSWDPLMRNVMIVGMGTLGLLVLQFISRRGVENIIAVDIKNAHFKLAKKLGATHTINSKMGNISEQVRNITNGLGADLIINTAEANKEILDQLLSLVKKEGKISCVSEVRKKFLFDYFSMTHKRVVLIGIIGGEIWYIPSILRMIEKKLIDTKTLITHRFPLEKVQEAFNLTYKSESIKVIMNP